MDNPLCVCQLPSNDSTKLSVYYLCCKELMYERTICLCSNRSIFVGQVLSCHVTLLPTLRCLTVEEENAQNRPPKIRAISGRRQLVRAIKETVYLHTRAPWICDMHGCSVCSLLNSKGNYCKCIYFAPAHNLQENVLYFCCFVLML